MSMEIIREDWDYYIQGGKAYKNHNYMQNMKEVRKFKMGGHTELDESYDESEIL